MALFFAKNPVVVTVSTTEVPLGIVVLTVEIDGHEYEFRTEAAQELTFDVSSAFRAEYIRKGDLVPGGVMSYVPLVGTYRARMEKLENGNVVTIYGLKCEGGTGDVYRGGLADDLLFLEGEPKAALGEHWTRKPQGEIVGMGEPYILPNTTGSEMKVDMSNGVGVGTPPEGVWVDDNPDRQCFAFVNSFGLIETASACMKESKSHKIGREEFGLARMKGEGPKVTRRMKTVSRVMQWKMSSGWVDRKWAEWWATEFCCSERHWMWTGSKWLPVTINPGDEVEIYDRSKGELHSVNFTVKSGY